MENLPDRAKLAVELARHRPALLAYARCLVREPADAEDLVQSALLSALEHAAQLESPASARNWLYAILRNQYRRGSRVRERTVEEQDWERLAADAGWAAPSPDPLLELESAERAARLHAAFLMLEVEDREIVLLRDVEEIDGAETAQLLGLGLAAMKSRLHRARLRLLAALRNLPGAAGMEKQPMAMTCLEVLRCLADYADNTLETPARKAVDDHVAVCQACARFGKRYANLLSALPSLSRNASPHFLTLSRDETQEKAVDTRRAPVSARKHT